MKGKSKIKALINNTKARRDNPVIDPLTNFVSV